MGLHQKKRTLKPGLPECVGLALLVWATVSAAFWLKERGQAGWEETQAQIVSISPPSDGREETTTQGVVTYQYTVAGETFSGQLQGRWVGKLLAAMAPDDIKALLQAHGYTSEAGWPKDLKEALRTQGYTKMEDLPQAFQDRLRAEGYTSLEDLPKNIEAYLRSKSPHAEAQSPQREGETPVEPHPTRRLDRSLALPRQPEFPFGILFFISLGAACSYHVWLYPAWRRKWQRATSASN